MYIIIFGGLGEGTPSYPYPHLRHPPAPFLSPSPCPSFRTLSPTLHQTPTPASHPTSPVSHPTSSPSFSSTFSPPCPCPTASDPNPQPTRTSRRPTWGPTPLQPPRPPSSSESSLPLHPPGTQHT